MADKIDFSQTSYILGIVSIVMAFFSPLAGIVFGIIGLVQSNKQKTKISRLSKTLNITGIILGIIVAILTFIVFVSLGEIDFIN